MINFDNQLYLEAHRYWMGLLLCHATTGRQISAELVTSHLADLKNGLPIDYLDPNGPLDPASWDEENLVRYPFYEAVGIELADRIGRFSLSGDINDLTNTR